MTRWTAVIAPKVVLVRVDSTRASKAGRPVPRWRVLWDRNRNGRLDSRDVVIEFYDITRTPRRLRGSCIGGCSSAYPGIQVYEHAVTRAEIKRFGTRFRRIIATARTQHRWMKKVPSIRRGLCYAYWRGSVLPNPRMMSFHPAFSLRTRLYMRGFARVHIPASGTIDPRLCRGVDVSYLLPRPDREKASLRVRITAGGIIYPSWLLLLFSTYAFKRMALALNGCVAASYVFKGAHYVHLKIMP